MKIYSNTINLLIILAITALGGISLQGELHSLEHLHPEMDFKQLGLNKAALYRALDALASESYSLDKLDFAPLFPSKDDCNLFTFVLEGKKYLLKTLNTKRDFRERYNEIIAHRYASKISISPPLLYVDNGFTMAIMPYIDGHPFSSSDRSDLKLLESLGAMAARLHRYPDKFEQQSQSEKTRKYYERIVYRGVAVPTNFYHAYLDYQQEGLSLLKTTRFLCHGSLHPSHIIIRGDRTPFIIDWSSATADDRYTDLGYFTYLAGLNNEQSESFLKGYFGRHASPEEWRQLHLAQRRTNFVSAVIWFSNSEDHTDLEAPLIDRVAELDKLQIDEDLPLAQENIAEGKIFHHLPGDKRQRKLIALSFLKSYLLWNRAD